MAFVNYCRRSYTRMGTHIHVFGMGWGHGKFKNISSFFLETLFKIVFKKKKTAVKFSEKI